MISYAIDLRNFKCKSIGRAPIAHPPGKDTLPFLNFDINGPKTSIPARIVFTNS